MLSLSQTKKRKLEADDDAHCAESLSPPIQHMPDRLISSGLEHHKRIFVCFQSRDMFRSFSLKSVELSNLFKSYEHDDSVLQQVSDTWEDDSVLQQVSGTWDEPASACGVLVHFRFLPIKAAANTFYAIFHGLGGADDLVVPEPTLTMLKYSVSVESSIIKLHETPTKAMNSRVKHMEPIIVEINGLIYVLAQGVSLHFVKLDEECIIVFQVYKPLEDSWKTLPAPPFLGSNSYQHMVVGSKFYISTELVSSVFCTKTEKWADSMSPPFPTRILESQDLLVVCEDVLMLCPYPGGVFAYKVLESGEIEFMHELWEEGFDGMYYFDDFRLFHLGDGHICVMVLTWPPEEVHKSNSSYPEPTIMKFFVFQVSKSPDGKTLNSTAPGDALVSTVKLSKYQPVSSVFAC